MSQEEKAHQSVVNVAAAALIDSAGNILIAQRTA